MHAEPHVFHAMRNELRDPQLWQTRVVVLTFGALSGLFVVTFTWLTEHALALFHSMSSAVYWLPLFWTPLCTALAVWCTRLWATGAAGSGIPQVMAALHHDINATDRKLFVSMRLSLSKMGLTTLGLLGGLSQGREGPSVQIAAGVMHSARHWLPRTSAVSIHGLLIAGGSAGIAAAFNTPLGGIMFAIEELSRRPEQRNNGLVMAAIVLAGLIGISIYGNNSYFGIIRTQQMNWGLLLPGLLITLSCGLSGGLFARLLTHSLSNTGTDRFSHWRRHYPIRFAALCGLVVAIIGLVSHGRTFGSGYLHTKTLLEGTADANNPLYVPLKFLATWISSWSGVPGGIFAPSLAIGGAMGANVAQWTGQLDTPTLIALGMVAFLAAVTQAPMTAFIIVMEMVDGHGLVLSLMASAMMASAISRWTSRPLYETLTEFQLLRRPPKTTPHGR